MSKIRKDPYYEKAKKMRYRSRASFKLIELNEKFDFLKTPRTVVDLGCAPGGFLQVCRRTCPSETKIIGVDVCEVKEIEGVETIKGDFTTEKCIDELCHKLDGEKVDVVLHDGSPNIGSSFERDLFSQNELVLKALEICVKVLKPQDGVFVTKVFRGGYINNIRSVLNSCFEKVELLKPSASRSSSCEIYCVCLEFKGQENISNVNNLYDSKNVLNDSFLTEQLID